MFGLKKKIKLILTADEKRLLLHALISSRNNLLAQGRYTDAIDDLLLKFK